MEVRIIRRTEGGLPTGFQVQRGGQAWWVAIGSGAGTRIRTGDLPLTRRLLYQLSYAGMGRAF